MAEDNVEITQEHVTKAEDAVGAGFWGTTPQTVEPVVQVSEPVKEPETTAEPIIESGDTLDEDVYVKNTFGYDSADIIKQQLAELKQLKEKPQATTEEKEWANEQSKQIHELIRTGKSREVRKILETQERIEDLTTAEVSKDTAAEIIKLGMQLKYKDLTPQEIEYKYSKQFSIPKQPVQRDDETDEDFVVRKNDWQEQVNDIETNKIIEAKLTKPELEKLKSQIVLPDISNPKPNTETKQPTQEELEAVKKNVDGFIQIVNDDLKDFNEFNLSYKDEAVEIPVNYILSVEEKAKVASQLKAFAEKNFDANAIFSERWLDDKGMLNVSRMTRDLARLNSLEKIDQKLIDDAIGKRMKEYTKEKKNIKINTGTQKPNGNFDTAKAMEEVEAAVWNAKK